MAAAKVLSSANVYMLQRDPALPGVYVFHDGSLGRHTWIMPRESGVAIRTESTEGRRESPFIEDAASIDQAEALLDQAETFVRSTIQMLREINASNPPGQFESSEFRMSHINIVCRPDRLGIEIVLHQMGSYGGIVSIWTTASGGIDIHETGCLNRHRLHAAAAETLIRSVIEDARAMCADALPFFVGTHG